MVRCNPIDCAIEGRCFDSLYMVYQSEGKATAMYFRTLTRGLKRSDKGEPVTPTSKMRRQTSRDRVGLKYEMNLYPSRRNSVLDEVLQTSKNRFCIS